MIELKKSLVESNQNQTKKKLLIDYSNKSNNQFSRIFKTLVLIPQIVIEKSNATKDPPCFSM